MVAHRFEQVDNGDIELRVAVAGGGPLMVFVHGWPELWYSWRHQMDQFADRFTVAAMDVRGYGGSSKPDEVERYAMTELTSDVAAVIEALSDDGTAIVIGHDWGAPIAWNTARLYADHVSAVAGLSVPYAPIGPVSSLELWREAYADRFFYQLYFQEPGVAEAELGADVARSLRMIWYSASADGRDALIGHKPPDARMLDGLVDPDPFPDWSTPDDLAVYVEAFEAGGWTGPLNRYRAQGIDSEQLGLVDDPPPDIAQPAAFVAGAFDPVRRFVPGLDLFDLAGNHCRDLRVHRVIEGAGHWVQQEAPKATNAALDEFLATL